MVQPIPVDSSQPGDPAAKLRRTFPLDQQRVVVDPDRAGDDRAVAADGMAEPTHEPGCRLRHRHRIAFWGRLPNFALFAYCFYLGVALPKLLSNAATAKLLGNGIGVVLALALLPPVEYLYVSNRLWLPYKFFVDTLVSAYVIAFVLLRPDCRRGKFLDRPVLVWLGDVSYSFYCYAMPVLIAVAAALLVIVPAPIATSDLGATAIVIAVASFCVAISLLLAHVSFARVERPCIAIGRVWSKRIERGERAPAPSFI
jgi:peptidoglycan/LPS O-acetylase OafA/YrhL